MFDKLTIFIDDKPLEVINESFYLNNNISIIAKPGDGKNVLLGKIINGILRVKKEREIYMLTDNKGELNFINERVKVNTQDVNEALNILKVISNESKKPTTIVINNLEKFINKNKELENEIIKLFAIGRAKNINIIAVMQEEHKIIDDNAEFKLISVGKGRFSCVYE